MKLMKKLLGLSLVLVSAVALTACDEKEEVESGYIYYSYTSALGTNWNPHTWETNADSGMMSYIESPFVDVTVKNSETGEYQWVYEMATSIEDVTDKHRDDLVKYGATLPESAKSWDEVSKDFVYEIKLNPSAQWQDGTPINADSYIYSMKQFLDPELQNYRANNYYTGSSAIAGAFEYYYQGTSVPSTVVEYPTYMLDNVAPVFDITPLMQAGFGCNPDQVKGSGYDGYVQLADGTYLYDKYPALFGGEGTDNEFTEANVVAFMNDFATTSFFAQMGMSWGDPAEVYSIIANSTEELTEEQLGKIGDASYIFTVTKSYADNVSYEDTVGLYKVDDYTIRYVCKNAYEEFYFKVSMASNWLVHEELYEACKNFDNDVYTTTYGTSAETTMSYGPYIMQSLQDGKQVVYVQNEKWYGYTKLEDGSLYSETPFEVDGKKVQQYQTTKIVIDVMTPDAAKLAFESGKISEYAPTASELPGYSLSDQLYQADETYTMRLFYNTNLEALQEMDKSKGNQNSVVMSNINFRRAFSLAVDRIDWVTTTAGYKPAYSLINSLYYYNVAEDPTSIFRNTPEAMQSICDIYGVTYGEGENYATLEEAYKAITGYNLSEAQALMKQAHDELVAENLYTSGQDIKIRVAWKAGAPESDDYAQLAKLEGYLNAAVAGSGFGKVTLELVGNLKKRYEDVPNGEYAIGYGAWGGAAFYPFTMFQVYMDPSYAALHEAGCWDPTSEQLTLVVGYDENGEEIKDTMTYQKWSGCLEGEGKYAASSNEVKLLILSQLEKSFIELYYCMPLATSTVCSLLSYQVSYYTENYNIMYGYGGIRLMSYNYDNVQWHNYVKEQGGTLNYS